MIKKSIITISILFTLSLVLSFVLTCKADNMVAKPTFDPTPGTYDTSQNITISTTTNEANIYYTTDNSTPTTNSNEYTSAVELTNSAIIKAIAVKDGEESDIASGEYIISGSNTVVTPTFSHGIEGTTIGISTITSEATIYYTTDNSTPTTNSNEYTEPLNLSYSNIDAVKAIAVKASMDNSSVATFTCSTCH